MELRSEVKENWVKSFKNIYEYAKLRAVEQEVKIISEAGGSTVKSFKKIKYRNKSL